MLASSPVYPHMELWLHLWGVLHNPQMYYDTAHDEVLRDSLKTPVFQAGMESDWAMIVGEEVPPAVEPEVEPGTGMEAIVEFMSLIDRAVAGTSYEVAST